jgi:hypothetical protein
LDRYWTGFRLKRTWRDQFIVDIEVGLQSRLTILPVRGGQKDFERAEGPGVERLLDSVV